MLLYLCSADPGLTRRHVPGQPGKRPSGGAATEVWLSGYRIGAALRQARLEHEHKGPSDGTGRSVTPHLRRAHFHSYWVGSRSDPDARHLELRWLPPIPVNVDRGDARGVVVRPAAP